MEIPENMMEDLALKEFVQMLSTEVTIMSQAIIELATMQLTVKQLNKFLKKVEKIRAEFEEIENEIEGDDE